jgi:hypothetical protein
MSKKSFSQLVFGALAVLGLGCGSGTLKSGQGTGGSGGTLPTTGGTTGSGGIDGAIDGAIDVGGATGSGGLDGGTTATTGRGGAIGSGGILGGGTGGIFVISFPDGGFPALPDGGLAVLLGDGGIMGGILDAPRDSPLGELICAPEAKLGTPCGGSSQGCILPSLGGACICLNGVYLCPADTTSGPRTCPADATTGSACTSPLTTCLGAGTTACICGLGTYTCL